MSRNKLQVSMIKELLRQEGFDRVERLRDEDVADTLKFPSRKEIEDVINLMERFDTLFDKTPKTLKKLEEHGLVIPHELESKIKTASSIKQRRKDPMKTLENYEYSEQERVTLADYFEIARQGNNPDEIQTNAGVVKVDELRRELYNEFSYYYSNNEEGYSSIYMGERFQTEFTEMMQEVLSDFNNNQIIALYGLYDSGNLFSNIEDYDSENDGVNIRGLFTLKQHMADARSYR